MPSQHHSAILLTIAAGALACVVLSADAPTAPAPASTGTASRPAPAAPRAAPSHPSLQSPFGPPVALAQDRPRRIAARRARMEARQYGTPDAYYAMDLGQLTGLARNGNAFALIQMAEQYESEWEALQDDPAFDRAADPLRLSRQLFLLAIKSGYPQVAAVMAVKSLDKDDLIDAYAWSMVADMYHGISSTELNRRKARFARLTPAERIQAQNTYSALARQLGISGAPFR